MADNDKKSLVERANAAANAPKKSKKPGRFSPKRIAKWFREMRSELKKVIWPTPKQTLNNTVVALVLMFAAAIVVYGFDYVAQLGVSTLIRFAK